MLFYCRSAETEAEMSKRKYEDTPDTLREAILSMQEKLMLHMDEFKEADLVYEAEMGDGRTILRPNPVVQEYRALIKDFASALKAYKDISGDEATEATAALDDLRSKFKVTA